MAQGREETALLKRITASQCITMQYVLKDAGIINTYTHRDKTRETGIRIQRRG